MEKKEGLRSAGCGKVISISDDDGGGDDDGENDVEDGNDGNRQRFVVKMKLPGNQAALQLVSEATGHQVRIYKPLLCHKLTKPLTPP